MPDERGKNYASRRSFSGCRGRPIESPRGKLEECAREAFSRGLKQGQRVQTKFFMYFLRIGVFKPHHPIFPFISLPCHIMHFIGA
jgi:hypothetical protein